MYALRALGCCLAVLALAACGSDAAKNRRAAVNTYLDDVSRAQVDLSGSVGVISSALAAFSLRDPSTTEQGRLQQGRKTVEQAIERVRKVDTPQDARVLQGLVLQRLVVQRDLLDELIATSADARRLGNSVPKLQLAAAQLRTDFSAIGAQQIPSSGRAGLLQRYGAAFARYGNALKPIAPTVAPGRRPSLLTPLLRSEHDGLVRSVALTRTIQLALRRRDIRTANAAVHSLLTIAASLNGPGAQQAEAAAARAYDARIRRITRLGIAISKERERLVKVVG